MAENTLYFAYGSNINLAQMARRCPDAHVMGPVTLENYELLFRHSGVATIAPCEGGKVPGLLWSITRGCEQALDRYEGYPRLYDKQKVTVRDSEGRSLSVMAYVMTEQYKEPAVPPAAYFDSIREGYIQNDLPVAELNKAFDHAVREVHAATERINKQAAKMPKGRKRCER